MARSRNFMIDVDMMGCRDADEQIQVSGRCFILSQPDISGHMQSTAHTLIARITMKLDFIIG